IRRSCLALSPKSSEPFMRSNGAESALFPNPSTPRRRCRHKGLTDQLKRSDACCQSCGSSTDTNAALPRGETERHSVSLLENKYKDNQQLRARKTNPIFLNSSNRLPTMTEQMPWVLEIESGGCCVEARSRGWG